MKMYARCLGVLLLSLGAIAGINLGFWLLRQPSDLSVAFGAATCLTVCFVGVWGLKLLLTGWANDSSRKGLVIIALAALGLYTGGCQTTIQPGFVGIMVDQYGSQRGVQDYPVKTGRVFYNPWTTDVIEYPVFVQTVQWTKNPNEGNPQDESITFTTKESVTINADVSLSYQLAQEKAPEFYVKFRHGKISDFTYSYMHNVARDAMMELGGHYTVENVMGDNEKFLHEVRDRIQEQMTPIGISISQFGFIGAPRPPESVIESINASQKAKYVAQQKENEVQQAKADADKRVAQAEGEKKSNDLLTQSLTPQVLEFQRIQIQRQSLDVQDRWISRWNGQVPSFVSNGNNGGTLFNLPAMPSAAK